MNEKITWEMIITESLKVLGNHAHLREIEEQCKLIAAQKGKKIPSTISATLRDAIHHKSSDSVKFKGKKDLYMSTFGIGAGYWGLR